MGWHHINPVIQSILGVFIKSYEKQIHKYPLQREVITQNHLFFVIPFFFFYNLKCPDQHSVDTRTSTNPKGARNTLLAHVPR